MDVCVRKIITRTVCFFFLKKFGRKRITVPSHEKIEHLFYKQGISQKRSNGLFSDWFYTLSRLMSKIFNGSQNSLVNFHISLNASRNYSKAYSNKYFKNDFKKFKNFMCEENYQRDIGVFFWQRLTENELLYRLPSQGKNLFYKQRIWISQNSPTNCSTTSFIRYSD